MTAQQAADSAALARVIALLDPAAEACTDWGMGRAVPAETICEAVGRECICGEHR